MFLSGIGLNVRTTMAVGRQVKEEGYVQAYQHSIVHNTSILPQPLAMAKSTFVNSIYSLGQAIILP